MPLRLKAAIRRSRIDLSTAWVSTVWLRAGDGAVAVTVTATAIANARQVALFAEDAAENRVHMLGVISEIEQLLEFIIAEILAYIAVGFQKI